MKMKERFIRLIFFIMKKGRLRPVLHSVRYLALAVNIRLGCKVSLKTNSLVYLSRASLKMKESFIRLIFFIMKKAD